MRLRPITTLLFALALAVVPHLVLAQGTAPAAAPKRVALVISVSTLATIRLNTPTADNDLVTRALTRAGFSVWQAKDYDPKATSNALNAFAERARKAEVALIYYAGVGYSLAGEDFVLPAVGRPDARRIDADFVKSIRISKDRLLSVAGGAKRSAIVVIDGGRAPLNVNATRSFGVKLKGLVFVPPRTIETYYLASSRSREDANDGNENSPFAISFARRVVEQGDILRVFGRVSEDMRIKTRNGQNPSLSVENLLGSPLCLIRCDAPGATAAIDRSAELAKASQRDCQGNLTIDASREMRLALLVGNTAYTGAGLQPLVAPNDDIEVLQKALTSTRFQVRRCFNLNQKELKAELQALHDALDRAVEDWGKRPQQGRPEKPSGFFYFSGHGAAGTDGRNYLIPVREEISKTDDLKLNAVAVKDVTDLLAGSGARLVFVVIDACRNALAEEKSGTSKGLYAEERRAGVLLGFATEPGKTAPDKSDYSRALASRITRAPGEEATLVFKDVAEDVRKTSNVQQRPWFEGGDYDGRYYFQPAS